MATYFTFARPDLLWLLIAVPLLIFAHLYFMHHARRKAILFGNFKTIERITGKKILTKNIILLIVRVLVVTSVVFAAAGTTLWRTGERADNDLVLVIDASASMATQDMDGPRITAAREAAYNFVENLDATMKIGVVQYSGLATVITEPTTDRGAVLRAIDSVQLKPIGGSDIAAALVTGANLLTTSEGGRVMVLLSDGVAALSLYDENPVPQALDYVRQRSVVVHTIGVGTQQTGSFIPALEANAALFDEQNLQTIANSTGGSYSWARDRTQMVNAFTRVAADRHQAQIPTDFSGGLLLAVFITVMLEWGLVNTRYRLLP